MTKDDIRYQAYMKILREELVPAMGCTEPIALAYCCAKARAVLGAVPDRCMVEASGNIIKNVKSVVVPNTGGLKGIEAAAAAGIVAGNEERELEVLSDVTARQKLEIKAYLEENHIEVRPLETEEVLDMAVTVYCGPNQARVRITGCHTKIVLMERNEEVLLEMAEQKAARRPDSFECGVHL